jgi:hypothetical protein
MIGETAPLLWRELHPLPIVEASRILLRETHPELLVESRLGGGDVGLKLYGIGAGVGDGVDEGVRQAKRTIVRLSNFSDDKSRFAGPNIAAGDT